MKRTLVLIILLLLSLANASAQEIRIQEKRKTGTTTTTLKGGKTYENMGLPKDNSGAKMIYKDSYNDTGLDNLEQKMAERDWASEPTAWERAKQTDTKESYLRYTAKYPSGKHIADAHVRMVQLDVEEALSKPHENLPAWECVEEDDSSPTSTVTIENHTNYPMTVMFSGFSTKSIVIPPYDKSSVTIDNGTYKVAASVPDARVRPFAGMQTVGGGRYKTDFYIVRTY